MGKPFRTYYAPPLTEEEMEQNRVRSLPKPIKKKPGQQTAEQIMERTAAKMAKESPFKAKQRAERAELHALLMAEHDLAREAKRLAKILSESN
jgi:hypothetical protein